MTEQVDYWIDLWKNDQAYWQLGSIHPCLLKHVSRLQCSEKGNKLFVPLSGKSLDIKWLADRSNTVVGVEASSQACQEFFSDNKLDVVVEDMKEIPGGQLYCTLDRRIRLYCCDFFKFSTAIESDFDGIWDRGSFEALEADDRKAYAKLIKTFMKGKETRYLLEVVERKPSTTPPYGVPEEEIQSIFGEDCKVERIDAFTELPEPVKAGVNLEGIGIQALLLYTISLK